MDIQIIIDASSIDSIESGIASGDVANVILTPENEIKVVYDAGMHLGAYIGCVVVSQEMIDFINS